MINPDILQKLFKAYDIRGKVGSELTTEVAQKTGQAFGAWLPEAGSVAVGRDMRPDSKELADALIAGLRASGRDVVDMGQITSDMIYFAVGKMNMAGGCVVTASHNPGEYNGIKFCREAARGISIESGLAEIRDAVIAGTFTPSEQGSLTTQNITESWIEHVLSFVQPDTIKPFNVAIDAGNGMAGAILPSLEAKLPLSVHQMYYELDGTFPNHEANPLVVENLADLAADVVEQGRDFGIAFDGDGDRAFFVDNKGRQVSGTILTAILARYFLEKEGSGVILYNAICGRIVPETIAKYGGDSERTKVGHSFIKDRMRERDALMAGESSGHYYFKDNYYADSGLIAAIIGLQVLSQTDKTLAELVDELSTHVSIQETNYAVVDKQAMMENIAQHFEGTATIDWLDGVSVHMENGWFNVRPSNTEPLLRFNAEATDAEALKIMTAAVEELIKA